MKTYNKKYTTCVIDKTVLKTIIYKVFDLSFSRMINTAKILSKETGIIVANKDLSNTNAILDFLYSIKNHYDDYLADYIKAKECPNIIVVFDKYYNKCYYCTLEDKKLVYGVFYKNDSNMILNDKLETL